MARALALAGLLILRADAGEHYHRLIAGAELSALIVCTGVAFDQLDVDRERGAVRNGSHFWRPRREIRSTGLE
jgi:hypothetical protein